MERTQGELKRKRGSMERNREGEGYKVWRKWDPPEWGGGKEDR